MLQTQKTILLFGAGKSASVLISTILQYSQTNNRKLIVVDANRALALSKTNNHPNATALSFDIYNEIERKKWIGVSDIVISMLPPALHYLIALDCIELKKNLLTASYLDDRIKKHAKEIVDNGLLFLYEMGLDPGIDHMSAMHLIQKIKDDGGTIMGFKSHCGGLVAPESDDNPWHYKISWNPANVVNAGKSGAIYKSNNKIIEIDYQDIFNDCTTVNIPGLGQLACYPNRDALSYIPLYGLEQVANFERTTLRYPEFCIGWNYIIQAGLTDTMLNKVIAGFEGKTISTWFEACLNFYSKVENFESFLQKRVLPEHQPLVKILFEYLGLNSTDKIPDNKNSSAEILQYLLETRLALKAEDKDMIVMLHEIEYQIDEKIKKVSSHLIVKGDNQQETAMAKTVGLPLFWAVELILENKISVKGLQVPVIKEIYEPVLNQLVSQGIKFTET